MDRAARTVEVVWSTGARARNFVPPLGMITEELDMSPNAVRMGGLRGGGAPVLNTHRRADARDVVGRVVAARLEAGRGYATLQFSSASDVEPLWQRIDDGTLRSVSVGYRVHRYEQIADPRDGTVHRAVDWEPYEISVVPLPVDPAAAVRGAGGERAGGRGCGSGTAAQPGCGDQVHVADSGSRADPGLAFIEAPTLVVHGAADGLVPLAYGRRLASLIGNAAFHPIAGAGHMPMLEAENAFVGAVAAFLGAEAATPRGRFTG